MEATTPQKKTVWTASDLRFAKHLGPVEFQGSDGEWHNFDILECPDRLVFGGACNAGFLESGYILREVEEHASALYNELVQELIEELTAYYCDGPINAPRLVCNDRM